MGSLGDTCVGRFHCKLQTNKRERPRDIPSQSKHGANSSRSAALWPIDPERANTKRGVKAVERGQEREIVIAHNGRPAAKLVPIEAPPAGPRIGVATGKFVVPDSIGTRNAEVARLFFGGQS